ncbi:hypothetical protein [Micromonospora sp. NPDC049801]|uniref:hypothetical protein n=1 Tax=unclassified Micromonospora TaxID=2617518 RepID=UPI0033ED2443
MIPDVSRKIPAYRRRLIAAGYLSRHHIGAGYTNLTGDGLDLAERLMATFHDLVAAHWSVDWVAHDAVMSDRTRLDTARAMSENFDCYLLEDGRPVLFDLNLAHLRWLRAAALDRTARAVVSASGIYRPVARTEPLIRDEYIAPFMAMHVVVPRGQLAEGWAAVEDILAGIAAAVGAPLLLVEQPPPPHYADRCLAALMPDPRDSLEPWSLAYELGPEFLAHLDAPDTAVLEIGISGRLLAFLAQLQTGLAAAFGSTVAPLHVHVRGEDPRAESMDTGLRCRVERRPVPAGALAPVLWVPGQARAALLVEDYSRWYPVDDPHQDLPELLGRADRLLADGATRRLTDIIHGAHAVHGRPTRGSLRVLRAPAPDLVGQHLVRRSYQPA